MSVLIKGMEMPANCFDCPCVDIEFMECAAKEHLSLPKDDFGAVLGAIPNWCPLVPVPPHGRLIDGNKLMDSFGYSPGDTYEDKIWIRAARRIIIEAPTIVPADPAEEGEG